MTPEQLTSLAKRWQGEIALYERLVTDWEKRGCRVVERYLDERPLTANGTDVTNEAKFNILWSNTQTIFPAVYAKPPKPQVSRRYMDRDPVGRTASLILERSLEFEIEQYPDYLSAIGAALLDRLLPGRGIAWVRYEPTFGQRPVQISEDDISAASEPEDTDATDQASTDAAPATEEYTESECSPVDYVNWKDFGHCFARTWEEVPGVWRRVYMTKPELEERFGDLGKTFGYEIADIPLDHAPDEVKNNKDAGTEYQKRAAIYEIWDKSKKRAIWCNKTLKVPLDVRDDPLELDGFYPCPKPLYATHSNESLIPVPDFVMYQDQARELDETTNRIGLLQTALKVVGLYDASQTAIKRLLSEGVNNTMIPVDQWAMFAQKGGIAGVVDWLPLDMVIKALDSLYTSREGIKQTIYEVTGLSDILRGATKSDETLGAQQLKANYASLRIKSLQTDMARFARDILRLKAEVICNHYSAETIVKMSVAEQIPDVQNHPELLPAALALLKNDVLRDFRIDVETDSMVQLDEQAEKSSRMEFLGAVGTFLEKTLPVVQFVPDMGTLLGELLMFGVRGFRVGRTIEGAFEDTVEKMNAKAQQPQQPRPDPRMLKAQGELQVKGQKAQGELAIRQGQVQGELQIDAAKAAHEAALKSRQQAQDAMLQPAPNQVM